MRPLSRRLLEASGWLRAAPWVLAAVGLVVTALTVAAVAWRLDDYRRASLQRTLDVSHTLSYAFSQVVRQRLTGLTVMQALLTRLSATGLPEADAFAQAVETVYPSSANSPHVLLLNPDGSVVHASNGATAGSSSGLLPAAADLRALRDGKLRVAFGQVAPIPGSADRGYAGVVPVTVAGRQLYLAQVSPERLYAFFISNRFTDEHAVIQMFAGGRRLVSADSSGLLDDAQMDSRYHSVFDVAQADAHAGPVEALLNARFELEHEGVSVVVGIPMNRALSYFNGRAKPATIATAASLLTVVLLVLGAVGVAARRVSASEGRLRRLVALDPLTSLPNRRSFTKMLRELVSRNRTGSVGVLFIDLDNFKYVNDTLGHEAGDALLSAVAQRLESAVRTTDSVCRLGGDEFTVLLNGIQDERDAEDVAQRILEMLAQPVQIYDKQLVVNASIGIALAPTDARTASELLRSADMAVYRAKALGKGCYARYEAAMLDAVQKRSRIGQALQGALERDELYLVYQPKVSLREGYISGFEALLRWEHPVSGPISPAEFIPVAEEIGLIHALTDFVISSSVRQMRRWHDEGHGWKPVAINVSALQLKNDHVVRSFEQALAEHDVPGHLLQVELTETALASDPEQAERVISQLKRLGLTLAVDDFGTGYSSLTTLQSFDVDCLKVDRSFVRDMVGSEDCAKICRAVVNLAHSLNVKVVAEGIETVAQYQALIALGCDDGQGFFFAKPLSVDDVPHWSAEITLFPLAEAA